MTDDKKVPGANAEATSNADSLAEKESGAKSKKQKKVRKKKDGARGKKKYVKWIVLGSIVLLILFFWFSCRQSAQAALAGTASLTDFTTLEYKDIQNTVSATGSVESADKTNVYSTQGYKIQSIPVEVGDYVEEGQVLLELDKESIEKQIKEKELSMDTSGASGSQSVKAARDTYNNYKEGLENGTNSSIISANSSVQTAYDNYMKAIKTYDDYAENVRRGEVSSVLSAEKTYNNAVDAYYAAETKYNGLVAAGSPQADIDSAYAAMKTAEVNVESTEAAYNAAYRASKSTLEDYQIAINTARNAYDTALQSQTAAEVAAQNQLEAYKNSLKSAQISANQELPDFQLEEMKKDLEKASITAPVSGTVTAIYAVEGASASGLLFVLEDIKNLIVNTTVKEFDIGTVKVGLSVAIKTDATGDDVFEGTISSIAPTANKNAQGNTDTTGDIQFATEIKVLRQDTPLKVGMSVRLEYILEKAQSVLAVPYDAVYQNANGENCVLIAEDIENGKVRLAEYKVTTGIENDMDIVITGEGITAGMRVVNTPSHYVAGQEITMTNQAATGSSGGAIMMGPGMRVGG